MTLPDHGALDWDTPLGNEISAARADAADAKANANSAQSNANEARQVAYAVKDFVEAPTDEQIGTKVAEDGSAAADAVDARIDTRVPAASEAAAGKVELATDAEALTGTDTARAVTPAGVKAVLDPIRDLSDATFATNLSASYAGKTVPLTLTASERVEIQRDSAPLNYVGTKAVLVAQVRDAASLADQAFSPGVVFQFKSTGDGYVNAGAHYSGSIWTGLFAAATKWGDGSQHAFTAAGELREVGAVGYNELGGFQGELTNVASTNGNISGVELLLKDSPDAGVTKFDTAMKAIIGRIAKYSTTRNRPTTAFMASSEGAVAPDSILSVNGTPAAPNAWHAGLDLSGATFETGVAAYLPNASVLDWLDSGDAAQPILGVSATDTTYLRPASAAANIELQTYAGGVGVQVNGTSGRMTVNTTTGNDILTLQALGTTKLNVKGDGSFDFNAGITTLAVGAAGGASAMPTPDGYLYCYVGGVQKRIAYFN